MKTLLQRILKKFGYRIASLKQEQDSEFDSLHARVKPFTMTSRERQRALADAVDYVERNKIPGAMVECGVWKGGSSMITALTLMKYGSTDRTLYLYDTYAGMSEPTDDDVNLHGHGAQSRWKELAREGVNEWDYAPLDEVRANLASTGYPGDKIVFVQGKVEDTIPNVIPEQIALLRLDTDWYESTRHELEHLFPRLVPGGILILDDYGHWQGARKAVDEYLETQGIKLFLNRIDYTGRIAVKM